jgi:hypothetical protein
MWCARSFFMNMVVCIMIGYGSGCCGLVLLRTSVEGSSGCIGPRAQGPSHMLGFFHVLPLGVHRAG